MPDAARTAGQPGDGSATPGQGQLRFEWRAGVLVGRWPDLEELGLEAVVTTSFGGVSSGSFAGLNLGLHVGDDPERVLENRRRALAVLGATLDEAVFAEQVHGDHVEVVGPGHAGRGAHRAADAVAASDALVTTSPGLVLAVLVADCVPALVLDPARRILGVAHAGWRGTARRVLPALVRATEDQGAVKADLHAALGPAVSPDRYVVGPEVLGALEAAGTPLDPPVARPGTEGWHLDLVAANLSQLAEVAVSPARVRTAGYSTEDRRFFSHRRAGPCGRFALLARLRP